MKRYFILSIVIILLAIGIAHADFTVPGKQMLVFTAAERQQVILDRALNTIIKVGSTMDAIKLRAGKINGAESAKVQSAYINLMKTKISDVSSAWSIAR